MTCKGVAKKMADGAMMSTPRGKLLIIDERCSDDSRQLHGNGAGTFSPPPARLHHIAQEEAIGVATAEREWEKRGPFQNVVKSVRTHSPHSTEFTFRDDPPSLFPPPTISVFIVLTRSVF